MARAEATEFAAQDGACILSACMNLRTEAVVSPCNSMHLTRTDSRGRGAWQRRSREREGPGAPLRRRPRESCRVKAAAARHLHAPGYALPPSGNVTLPPPVWFARPGFLARTPHDALPVARRCRYAMRRQPALGCEDGAPNTARLCCRLSTAVTKTKLVVFVVPVYIEFTGQLLEPSRLT